MTGMNWTIAEVLQSWETPAEFIGATVHQSQQLLGVSIDSRAINPGELFIAIRGERFDGHKFVDAAITSGAIAVIVDKKWFAKNNKSNNERVLIVVDDTLTALQNMASAYRKKCRPFVIGLTGTNGKTTTKEFMGNVIAKEKHTHKTSGNLNNHIGVPLTLLAMREPVDVAIVEMGMNHLGEIRRLCEIAQPNAAVITNIGRGHTEFVGGINGVRAAKRELFEFIAKQGTACVNLDDPQVMQAAREAGVHGQLSFGFQPHADVAGTDLQLDTAGCATFKWQDNQVQLTVPGLHNAGNALAAIAAAKLVGIFKESIVAGLAEPLGVTGRMHRMDIAGRIVLGDQYNANPESVEAALKTLVAMPVKIHRFAALGDMLELGEITAEAHVAVLKSALGKQLKNVYTFGPEMKKATYAVADNRIAHFTDKRELADQFIKDSHTGDALLVKGSRGMRMEEVITRLKERSQ